MFRMLDYLVNYFNTEFTQTVTPMMITTIPLYGSTACHSVWGHRFSLKLKRVLPSSGIQCSVGWCRTDVSELHIGSIFKGQAVQEEVWRA